MPGSDADIVLWNGALAQTVSAATQLQNTDYTPYEGMTFTGGAQRVLLMGETVAEGGRVVHSGLGRYVSRKPVEV